MFNWRPSEREAVDTASPVDAENPQTNDMTDVSSLGWETRVQCFGGCFVLSCVCSFCASTLLFLGRITGFCILTSMGSLLSLVGTCFLMGPVQQCKKMFDKSRWVASIAYIVLIAMSLIAGLVLQNPPLAVICTIGQYVAMAWYSLSYIPFARDWVSRVVCSCFD